MKEHFTFQNLALTFIMGMMIWGMTAVISLNAGIESLKETDTELKAEIRELGNRLTRIEVQLGTMEHRLGALEKRMDALEVQLGTLQTQVAALEKRVGTLENSVDDFISESRVRAGMATFLSTRLNHPSRSILPARVDAPVGRFPGQMLDP